MKRIGQLLGVPFQAVLTVWTRLDMERTQTPPSTTDILTTLYIYLVAAGCLVLSDLNYLGGEEAADWFISFLDNPDSATIHPNLYALVGWMAPSDSPILFSSYQELWHLSYWACIKIVAYLLIPALAIWLHPKLRFGQMGIGRQGFIKHLPLYGWLLLPILILVVAVSFLDSFSTYYPFYTQSGRSHFDFWVWESLYILQFFALEFFFRGFLLQVPQKTMGSGAIVAMMVPYVMIHFGKPWPESMAAIVAGLVLGTLAAATRSIWGGFLIHITVAVGMDVAANIQQGGISFLHRAFF